MAPTLEDLLNDLLALETKTQDIPARPGAPKITPLPTRGEQVAVCRTGTELPIELRQELHLPESSNEIYRHLKKFQSANRHRPFKLMSDSRVFYIEFEAQTSIIRVYIGQASTFAFRQNDTSATFVVEEVFQYENLESNGENVRVRKIKPEDFLSFLDRNQGKAINTVICFAIFAANTGSSTHILKPERAIQPGYSPVKKRQVS
jgi:hypothetical protein